MRRPAAKLREKAGNREQLPAALIVYVRDTGRAFTARALGKTAGSLESAHRAVRRLGDQLGFLPGFDAVYVGNDPDDARAHIWKIVRP